MKKILALLFAALLFICGLSGCGGKKETERATVTLPAVSAERAAVERAGAIATRLYIIARLKTDALIEFDFKKGSLAELKAMTDATAEAWRLCEIASVKTAELADYAQKLHSAAPGQTPTIAYTAPKSEGVFSVAYAAKGNAATKWAEDLTAKFDSYPTGQKIKQLAEELGTDAKRAYAQVKMAQDILAGAGYESEAEVMKKCEQLAMATKTVCKTTLYVTGVVAGGGVAKGVIEAGSMVISGLDTMVDIASTGSTIILGENSLVTKTADGVKKIIAPISAVNGLVGVFNGDSIMSGFEAGKKLSDQMSSLDKLNFFADNALEYAYDGTILGGIIKMDNTSKAPEITLVEIDTKGKAPAEVTQELKEAGLPVTPVPEESKPKTAAEAAAELEKQTPITEADLNAAMENLRNIIYEILLTAQPPTATVGRVASLDEIVGTYDCVYHEEGAMAEAGIQTGTIVFSKNDSGQVIKNGDYDDPYSFDPTTGTATFIREGRSLSTKITHVFTVQNGIVHMSGTGVLVGTDHSTGTTGTQYHYGTGVKIN